MNLTIKGSNIIKPNNPMEGLTWKPSIKTLTCGATRETMPKVKSEIKISRMTGTATLIAVNQRFAPSSMIWIASWGEPKLAILPTGRAVKL